MICVTHLPQIAGFADHHYSVEKHTAKGRTLASVEELTPEARTREIGRMLFGRARDRGGSAPRRAVDQAGVSPVGAPQLNG